MHASCFSRFPVGQEDRRQPTQEGGERQNPHRQHWHGHGQDQGKKPHCLITTRGQQRLPLWPFIKYPPTCERVCQIFGSRVRVDSMAKVAEIEQAEKEKMKEKVDRILKHGINCFINRSENPASSPAAVGVARCSDLASSLTVSFPVAPADS